MPITQDRRLWIVGGALAAVLLLLASWFMLIQPKFSDTSSLRSQKTDAELQNTQLLNKVAKLKKQNDGIAQIQSDLATALKELPSDSGLPDLTREFTAHAAAHRVSISSISVGSIQPTSASGAVAAGGSQNTTGSQGAAGAASGSLYAIQLTVTTVGSLADQLAFVHALQYDGPRRALVTATQFGTAASGTSGSLDQVCSLTTQLTTFSSPTSSAAAAALTQQTTATHG